jgi:hypothetical protein
VKNRILYTILFLCLPVTILAIVAVHWQDSYRGKLASTWVEELRHNESAAMAALQNIGPRAVPPLRNALTSRAPTERCRAASALGKLGMAAKDAIPDLIRALDDPSSSVQCEAMLALSRLNITNQDITPKLISQLANQKTGAYAATLLNSIARQRKAEHLPAFPEDGHDYGMACLKSPIPSVRLNGAIKLASVAQEDPDAKKALESLSHDENGWVRQEVSRLITNSGALAGFRLVSE